ncbi:MAG: ABC transporter permease [Anaerolineae bacterium]|nr:ABC transporter permease [Anaerolineae bacterium]
MVNLLYTELLKLKRSEMFIISLVGACAAPLLCFIGFISINERRPGDPIFMPDAFWQTNFYIVALIGMLLYGVVTSYLFSREYMENTLKSLLTIPVSRLAYIFSKLVLLLLWISTLTLAAWVLTLILGIIGQFQGLNYEVLVSSLKAYMLGGFLLFLLSTPIIFVTLLLKNYVPTVVFTIMIGMVNIVIWQSEYRPFFPWSAAAVIVQNHFPPEFAPEVAYISIAAASLCGLFASIIYFSKSDVH